MGRSRWAGLALGIVVLWAVTGCSTLGIESRGARLARQLATDKDMLQTQLASTEAERAQVQSERDAQMAKNEAAQKQIADLNKRLIELAGKAGGVGGDPSGIRLSGDVLFRAGKVDVRPEAKPLLAKVANIVKQAGSGAVVYVDGHTDSDPLVHTKGLYRDNYGLAQARANAVARELTAMGVPRTTLVTRSFGPDKPVADNKTVAGKKQNRRVEISVAHAPAGVAASTTTHVSTAAKADIAPVAIPAVPAIRK